MNLALDNPLDDRLIQLLRHFGLARAHFAACMPRDWEGLAAKHPETISSLTLLAPMGFNITACKAPSFRYSSSSATRDARPKIHRAL